jgi:hypothetical protein
MDRYIDFDEEDQMFVTSENQRKRKIYFNTPYSNDETNLIDQVKVGLFRENLSGYFDDPIILKHIYAAKLSIDKAI